MHGPVRGKDGSYYFALNLVHDGTGSAYTAGGNVMGTWGGFNGWAVRVMPIGKFELFAYGMRSPASLGAAPTGASGTPTTRAISWPRRRCSS
jgi:hypothetical protein